MVSAVGYAYPWDFDGDPAAVERAAGLDAVAVAAAYHTTRAAGPLHPSRRLVDAAHAACYVAVRAERWAGRRLVPASPSWTPADSFGRARRVLRAAGLPVYAWTVLTHNSLLGRAHPDVCVRNAFGEAYPYALCPAVPEVADYCSTLVAEILTLGEPDGIVLEACGALGVVHGGHHDKTDLAGWTPAEQQLLSLCFCSACARLQIGAGLDPARVSGLVRDALRRRTGGTLDPELAGALRAVRTGIAHDLRTRLVGEIRATRPDARVVVHATSDPWATGAFATVAPSVDADVDVLVGSCWQAATGERELAGLADTGVPAIGGYIRPDVDLATPAAELVSRYRTAGLTELHLYHLGLVSAAGLRRFAEYADAMRE